MSHPHPYRPRVLAAVLFGLSLIALDGQSPVTLNAELIKPALSMQGVVIPANTDNVFFCTDKNLVKETFPLLSNELKQNTSIHFTITEYTGITMTEKGNTYVSQSTTNALKEFTRGKLYSIRTDADLYFKCNDGLSTGPQSGFVVQEGQIFDLPPAYNPTGFGSTGGIGGMPMGETIDPVTQDPTGFGGTEATSEFNHFGEPETPPVNPGTLSCPDMQCAFPIVPEGCQYVMNQLPNGCPACGTVICPDTNTETRPAATPPVTNGAQCPALSCPTPNIPRGCHYIFGTDENDCPACGTLNCDSTLAETNPLFLTLNDPAMTLVRRGSLMIFAFEMKNIGQKVLEDASFTIELPEGYRMPVGGALGKCTGGERSVTCTDFDIGENQNFSFSFPFIALPTAPCGEQRVRAVGRAHVQNGDDLPETYSNFSTWTVIDCGEASSAAQTSVAPASAAASSRASQGATSSAAASAASISTMGQDDTLSIELRGKPVVKAPGALQVQMIIRNKTAKAVQGVSFSFAVPYSGGAQMMPGTNCTIANSIVSCTNISLQPGQASAYNGTMQWTVTRDDCSLQPTFGANAQYTDAGGNLMSIGALLRWQWDCSLQTSNLDWAEVTATLPQRVRADTPFNWSVTVRNKLQGSAISFWLDLAIPENGSHSPMPGCGQGGPIMFCASGSTLTKGATETYTFGNLVLGPQYCNTTVDLGSMRVANMFQTGIMTVMGESTPLSVYVDCSPQSSTASSAASSMAASSHAASSTAPTGLIATLSGPDGLQKNSDATYTLVLKNASNTTMNGVSFSFALPAGITTRSVSASPNCSITATSMSCSQFVIQSQLSLTLTLPIHTLDTLPCTTIPLKATASGNGQGVTSNIINVAGCTGATGAASSAALLTTISAPQGFLLKNTAQSMIVTAAAFDTPFTDGHIHIEFPLGIEASTPVNSLNVGTCVAAGTTVDCTGISRNKNQGAQYTVPFFIGDTATCGKNNYSITFDYKENGIQKQITKPGSMQLCTAVEPDNGPLNQFTITTAAATCTTADCRTVRIPVTLQNKSFNTATNVMVIANLDTSWSGGTLDGADCMIIDTPTQRQLDCPGGPYLTIPPRTNTTYMLELTTDAPCPITTPRTAVLLQSAPASVYEVDYSDNSVYATLPAACQNQTTSSSSSRISSHSSAAAGESVTLTSIVIAGDVVTVDYEKNFTTCAHLMNPDFQRLNTQNSFCGNKGPIEVSRSAFTTLLQAGSPVVLCHGNNTGICSSPVIPTEESVHAAANANDSLAITFGGLNVTDTVCISTDCRQQMARVNLHNDGAAITDLKVDVALDPVWTSVKLKGLACVAGALNTNNQRVFSCPDLAVPSLVNSYQQIGLSLQTTAPCSPTTPFITNVRMSFKPGTIYALQYPYNPVTTDLTVPCNGTAAPAVPEPEEPLFPYGGYILSDPLVTNANPLDDNAQVHIKMGDTITFNSYLPQNINGSRSFGWFFNSSILQCVGTSQDISKNFTCTAINTGMTSVSMQTTTFRPDSTLESSNQSNIISVFVDEPKIFCGFIPSGGSGYQCEEMTENDCQSAQGTVSQTNAECWSKAPVASSSAAAQSSSSSGPVDPQLHGALFIRPDANYQVTGQLLKPGETGKNALHLLLDAKLEDISVEQMQFGIQKAAGGTIERLDIIDVETSETIATATSENCDSLQYGVRNESVFCMNVPRGTLVAEVGKLKAIGIRPVIASLENGALINAKFAVSLHLDPHSIVDDGYDLNLYPIGQTCANSLVCATGLTSGKRIRHTDYNDKTSHKNTYIPAGTVTITKASPTALNWFYGSITGPINTVVGPGTGAVTQNPLTMNNDMSLAIGVPGMNTASCLSDDCRKMLVPVSLFVKGVATFNYMTHISATVDPIWTSVKLQGNTCKVNTSYYHNDGLTIFDCPYISIPGSGPNSRGMGLVLETTNPCPLSDAYKNVTVLFSPGTWDNMHYPEDKSVPVLPQPCNGQTAGSVTGNFLGSLLQWFKR